MKKGAIHVAYGARVVDDHRVPRVRKGLPVPFLEDLDGDLILTERERNDEREEHRDDLHFPKVCRRDGEMVMMIGRWGGVE